MVRTTAYGLAVVSVLAAGCGGSEAPADPATGPSLGSGPQSVTGQSGGEGASTYACVCERLEGHLAVRARVEQVQAERGTLRIEAVLGDDVTEETARALVGVSLDGALAQTCSGTAQLAEGDERVALFTPSLIGRDESYPCEAYDRCMQQCEADSPPNRVGPLPRCETGCSLLADQRCGLQFDQVQDGEWVVFGEPDALNFDALGNWVSDPSQAAWSLESPAALGSLLQCRDELGAADEQPLDCDDAGACEGAGDDAPPPIGG